MKKFKKYNTEFNEYQYNIFQDVDCNGNKRHYLMSVFSYLIKYSNEEGLVSKSLSRLHLMYKRYHKKDWNTSEAISKSYFCQLVNDLVDLKLLVKDGRKVFIFKPTVDEIIDEKVDNENPCETLVNSNVSEGSEKPKYEGSIDNTYYTNTDIVKMISSFYKGIAGRKYASKKDLLDVAKSLFVLDRINEPVVQANVMSKLRNSKQQIHLNGVVQYVKSIIMDKLSEFDSLCPGYNVI